MKERKTMKITFLIGNGFDISCGMKSSYKDVCNVYKHTYSDNKVLQNFKDEISDWGDFEMELAAHASRSLNGPGQNTVRWNTNAECAVICW